MVVRFQADTLNFEHTLEGGAASFFPLLLQIQSEFGNKSFSPAQFSGATGVSLATAHRHIERLRRAGALQKLGYGEYVLIALKS